MTDHSDNRYHDNEQGAERSAPAADMGDIKRQRRVPKTMIEADFAHESALPEQQTQSLPKEDGAQAASEAKSERRVPKTMIEADFAQESALPEQPKEAQQQAPKKRRVAKTVLEIETANLVLRNLFSDPQQEDKVSSVEQAAPRRIAKTLVENVYLDSEDLHPREKSSERRIAKTLMESGSVALDDGSLTELQRSEGLTTSAPLPLPEPRSFVARTMLDSQALALAVAKYVDKKEARALEEAKEKANEPAKPFLGVTNFKLVKSCPYQWIQEEKPKERVRACATCNTWLYNFQGIELPDAEALVFKCQSIKSPTFFKRPDGKFMTLDCPVDTKKRRNQVLLIVMAALLISAVIAVLATIPPPAPEADDDDGDEIPAAAPAQAGAGTSSNSPSPSGAGASQAPLQTPAPTQVPTPMPDPVPVQNLPNQVPQT